MLGDMRPTDKPTKTETASPYVQVYVGPTHISLVAETELKVALIWFYHIP